MSSLFSQSFFPLDVKISKSGTIKVSLEDQKDSRKAILPIIQLLCLVLALVFIKKRYLFIYMQEISFAQNIETEFSVYFPGSPNNHQSTLFIHLKKNH